MPKPPIILPIARSKLAACLQTLLVLGLAFLASWTTGSWVGLIALGTGLGLVHRSYRAQPCGMLQLAERGNQLVGRWLLATGEVGAEQSVSCDYLGPWLAGLRLGPQRLWLWPDSLPRASQRALRRCFHRPGR